jgi:hypothetical protein
MSAKYLNINIGATAAAVIPTLVRIDDVSRITMPTPAGAAAGVLTLFYKSGGSSVITTQVQGVGSGSPTAAQTLNIIKGFWDAIIASIAQPWNLPVYPSPSSVWGQTYLPASQVPVVPAGQGAANPALSAKTGQAMQVTNGAGAVGDVVFVSVA